MPRADPGQYAKLQPYRPLTGTLRAHGRLPVGPTPRRGPSSRCCRLASPPAATPAGRRTAPVVPVVSADRRRGIDDWVEHHSDANGGFLGFGQTQSYEHVRNGAERAVDRAQGPQCRRAALPAGPHAGPLVRRQGRRAGAGVQPGRFAGRHAAADQRGRRALRAGRRHADAAAGRQRLRQRSAQQGPGAGAGDGAGHLRRPERDARDHSRRCGGPSSPWARRTPPASCRRCSPAAAATASRRWSGSGSSRR